MLKQKKTRKNKNKIKNKKKERKEEKEKKEKKRKKKKKGIFVGAQKRDKENTANPMKSANHSYLAQRLSMTRAVIL